MARFYDLRAWRKLRREILARDNYRCTRCGIYVGASGAARIDHIQLLTMAPSRAFDKTNLRTLCATCDNRSHNEKARHLKTRVDKVVHGVDELGYSRDPNHPWFRG
jgi:5-methylcytosine-specific restriction endonuclease McrA